MKILVTGGAGFIGSHTIRKLLSLHYAVVCVDNFNSYYDPKIKEHNILDFKKNKNFTLYKKDICDIGEMEKIFKKEKPDKIIHLAARAGVRPSIENPDLYFQTNVLGTLNLLKLSVQYHCQNFVYASSSSVYGSNKKIPFSEKDSTDNPISPYAASKKGAEELCYTYHYLYKLPISVLRFFTVYGPSGRPDMAPYLFVDAISKGRTITRFGKGNTKRDYTYIDDIVSGIISSLKKDFSFEIINLGNNKPVMLNKFISVIEKHLGKKAKIVEKPIPAGDVPITYADITKAKRLLGFRPKTTIEEGMGKFIKWYIKKC